MSSGFFIPLPEIEGLAERLAELPLFRQRVVFEHAVHKALDDLGWPRGERGTVAVPVSYWYVVLFKDGCLKGHVGPIPEEASARRTASSWRDGGLRATVSRRPVGPLENLTVIDGVCMVKKRSPCARTGRPASTTSAARHSPS